MVKRTIAVLGILALMLMAVATSHAFIGGAGWQLSSSSCPPMYVPVDCPPVPFNKTIVKTWSCKIEGPCPPPMAACAPGSGFGGNGTGPFFTDYARFGLRGGLVAALATPFDWLFGGFDGVYGCTFAGGGRDDACGPCFGPIPCAVGGVGMFLAAPTVLVSGLW